MIGELGFGKNPSLAVESSEAVFLMLFNSLLASSLALTNDLVTAASEGLKNSLPIPVETPSIW